MNQTKKRLSIIKLAISITDIETIQLQVLKLGLLKTDDKIQDIITMLQTENYAQAQGLITAYIETPKEDIVQRSSQKDKQFLTKEELSTIDEFELFMTSEEHENKIEIDINDYLSDLAPARQLSEKKQKTIKDVPQEINDFMNMTSVPGTEAKKAPKDAYDDLLNINSHNILTDNIDIDISHTEKDAFFSLPDQDSITTIDTSDIPQDTFFDIPEKDKKDPLADESEHPVSISMKNHTLKANIQKNMTTEETQLSSVNTEEEENFSKADKTPVQEEEQSHSSNYKAIPYLADKLENMKKQYPSIYTSHEIFPSINTLLTKISQEGYTEEEIEGHLRQIKTLNNEKQYPQALQLLYLCAATESKFSQLLFARELYKGTLLTQDIPQSFILLNTLAMDDYPEALCDLGQFYENGIGTKKDKKRALHLYKDAMDLGIKRAQAHVERLSKKNKNKSFFRK